MSKGRYGLFIERTRGLEDHIKNYKSYVLQDHRHRQLANWENKTASKIYKNQEQEEIDSLKRQKENFLNIRRNKLSNLLKKEYEQYHQELLSNQDTPENQRQMMEEKLNYFKNLRENERLKFVDLQKEKMFYNDNEEVRKYDSEYNELKCNLEQENQMLDKLKRRYNNYLEEKAFDDVNKFCTPICEKRHVTIRTESPEGISVNCYKDEMLQLMTYLVVVMLMKYTKWHL